jgi:Skp family chaperone for outer membrane proteins
MKIYIVDFEEVLKNYVNYHESLKKIQAEKDKFSDDIEKIKKEMEGIISSSKLLVDERSQMEQGVRFKELQTRAIKLESEFRNDIVGLQNKELEDNFGQISDLVSDWAKKAEIDLVINKSQSIFVSEKYDATEVIIDLLKNNNLYHEFKESEYLETE